MKVLFLSNGAGEDAIAAEIARRTRGLTLEAMPVVGAGAAWRGVAAIVGPQRTLPSGGLIPESYWRLWRDVGEGLVGLILRQLLFLRRQRPAVTVAVGDLWPVVLAGLSGLRPLVFVGTAKSDHHHPYSGLEAWVLRRFVDLALVRDEPTAAHLRRRGAPAACVGNAMMDGLEPTGADLGVAPGEVCLALFPGSREGTYAALPPMLEAYRILCATVAPPPRALVALAPSVDLERLGSASGWTMVRTGRASGAVAELQGPAPPVQLVQGAFADVLHRSTLALGQAGTANEQAAGLGIPVVAMEPGGEARLGWYRGRQKGLLGDALLVVEDEPAAAAAALRLLLEDSAERGRRGAIGRARLGPAGGGLAMARLLERFASGQRPRPEDVGSGPA